mgnify:CR=1 FL=1
MDPAHDKSLSAKGQITFKQKFSHTDFDEAFIALDFTFHAEL